MRTRALLVASLAGLLLVPAASASHPHRVKLPAPAAGTSHFAYLTSYSAANIAPVSGIDEQIAHGRYVLGVIVTAGTSSDVAAVAPKLAKKLDARFRQARRGHLHAKPV